MSEPEGRDPWPGPSPYGGWEFVPAGHFYSVVPSAEDRVRATRVDRGHVEIAGVELRLDQQVALLRERIPAVAALPFLRRVPCRYDRASVNFPLGDAAWLGLMVGHLQPRRFVEVGCGESTLALLDAVDALAEHPVQVTLVEPFPERLLELLAPADRERVELLIVPLQQLDLARIDALEAGDVLFVDSTHVLKMGSDVKHLLDEVLPRLAPGVVVHLHDIMWPFEYRKKWIDEGRAWNEAYAVRAFLQFNSAFEIVLFGNLVADRHPELCSELVPDYAPFASGSLWLRRTG